jgi:hypothetical protein
MNDLDLMLENPEAVLTAVNELFREPTAWEAALRKALLRKDFRMFLVDTNCVVSGVWVPVFNDALKDLSIRDIRLSKSGVILRCDEPKPRRRRAI